MKTSILAVVFVLADAVFAQENQCIICPNGPSTGLDDYAPYANDGDSRTCAAFIDEAKQYESGTEDCGYAELHEAQCCYSEPVNPCLICPDGVTATGGEEYVPEYDGNTLTCANLIATAILFESWSDACALYDIDVEYCCPPSTTLAPVATPVPEGNTEPVVMEQQGENNGITVIPGASAGIIFVAIFVNLVLFTNRRKTAHNANGAAPATDPAELFRMPGGGIPSAVAIRIDPEAGVSNATNSGSPPSYAPRAPHPSKAGDSKVKTPEFPLTPFVRHGSAPPLAQEKTNSLSS